MSANLLDLTKGYLSSEVMSKASNFIGEDESTTQSAFDHILPTLLGGMVEKSKDKSGASDLFGMVTKPELGGGLLNNLGDLFTQNETSNNAMNLGGNLVNSLMGNRSNKIVDLISSAVGMKSGSTSNLMKMAMPILLSVIGKKVKTDGLGLDGFMSMMQDQDKHVKEHAPAGFFDKILGAFGVSQLGSAVGKQVDNVKEKVGATTAAASSTASKATERVRDTASKATDTDSSSGSGLSRILPIILIVAALALAYWLWQNCDDTDAVGDDLNEGVEQVEETAREGMNSVKEGAQNVYSILGAAKPNGTYNEETNRYEFNTGDLVELELPDGETIEVAEQGAANTLYKLINSDKFTVSDDKSKGWFTLDGVYFRTGSANLDPVSEGKLQNVASVLKAYPNVNLKIGGYTSNTGSLETNMELSQQRAEATMNKIASLGVDANRLAAEGYGPEHPICEANDTPACRAQNRRVDIRITKK